MYFSFNFSLSALIFILALGVKDSRASAIEENQGLHDVKLISAVDSIAPDTTFIILAIDINLNHGWKTYWRSPGRYGAPLTFNVSSSKNVSKFIPLWPAPTRYVNKLFPHLSTVGYSDRLVLPLRVELISPGKEIDITLNLSFGICQEMCVWVERDVGIRLYNGASLKTQHSSLIKHWIDRVPKKLDSDEGTKILATYDKEKYNELILYVCNNDRIITPELFIETKKPVSFNTPIKLIKKHKDLSIYAAIIDDNNKNYIFPPGTEITIIAVEENIAFEKSILVERNIKNISLLCH